MEESSGHEIVERDKRVKDVREKTVEEDLRIQMGAEPDHDLSSLQVLLVLPMALLKV